MASNFFEQQDVARKKTGQLVVLFAAAVLGIVLLIYGLVLVLFVANADSQTYDPAAAAAPSPPYIGAFLLTLFAVIAVVGGCSLFKIAALRSGGGESVARMMGGRLLSSDASDLYERKVLNVVEEMALASGTAVPPVYVMEQERGINAFAAGYTPDSAVIGVTRGAIEKLSRDELQGVIAHEFSHILNGDMRLNIKLMGVVFGIIAIAVIGRVMIRAAWFAGSGRRKDARAAIAISVLGLALLIIGGVGVFFGRMIQAAVSRQREYLADASAVQFTRNPDSIAGALKKIGGFSSNISDGHATEINHMFIASASSGWAFGPFATHPPLEERIKRVDPSWDGRFPDPAKVIAQQTLSTPKPKKTSPIPMLGGEANPLGGMTDAVVGAAILGDAVQGQQASGSAIDQVGSVSPTHVAYMRELLAQIPEALKDAAHGAYGARAVVYTVLLDSDSAVRDKQLNHLSKHADPQVAELTRRLVEVGRALPMEARLPLIDMSVPALRQMSDGQYDDFKKNVDTLIKADGRVELFEWVLQRMLLRHLDAHFNPKPDPNVKYGSLKPVGVPCGTVLSILAHAGQRDPGDVQAAFDAGTRELEVEGVLLQDRGSVKLREVGKALDTLIHASPQAKKKLIKACALAIAADGQVTRSEGELMRAVADSLGVPMPPLLPGQKLV